MKSKFTEHEINIAGLIGAIFGFISGAGLMTLIAIIF